MGTHLDLVRDKSKEFPEIERPWSIRTARIWHCSYTSLAPLSRFHNLRELSIASFPDEELDAIGLLEGLQSLSMVHLPKISSLEPLARLRQLRKLCLATLPSWDSGGKVTIVESLRPLTKLPLLEELDIFGVVNKAKRIDELFFSESLRRVRVSKIPRPQVELLSAWLERRQQQRWNREI